MKMTCIKKIALAALVALAANHIFALDQSAGVERYGLYIGSNDGGKSQERLLYAGTDAIAFQKIMTEIGGISKSNGILLLDPAKEDVDSAFEVISELMKKKQKDAKRSEFVFYYSGHSDENALLLGKTKYDYSSLKAAITNVPSDVHVVILDSCYSGNFIRTKGGQKQKPFLMDDSSVVKGHAYLSSSSSQESSQESDEIGSSFFTNAMITGLRGAADTSGDKKVTLNELYSYAFNETLSKTEKTADPQHPNYNITLVGSGDLVLSDVSASDCVLTLARELTGRVIVRDKNSKLVAEINKTTQLPIYLALEEGQYGVTVIGERSTLQGSFALSPKKTYAISPANLSPVARSETRSRGSEAEEQPQTGAAETIGESDLLRMPIVFSIFCNEFYLAAKKPISTKFSLALFRSHVYEANGVMAAGIGNETTILNGAQAAGIYNIAQDVNGAQAAGIFNFAKNDVNGAQVAGIFNYAQNVTGAQAAGIVNVANDVKYAQAAWISNVAKGSFTGAQGAWISNVTMGDFKGAQGAWLSNVTLGEFKGVQGSWLSNVARKDFTGLQAAWLSNVACGNVKGVQIGFFNFCKGNADFQLGLINYSQNGIFEVAASYTTDQKIRLVLNSGNKHLYGIFGVLLNPEGFGKKALEQYGALVLGLGTRVELWKFNFDFAIMGNEVIFANEKSDKVHAEWFPSARIEAGFTPIPHLNVFAGFGMAFEFPGNRDAFIAHKRNMAIDAGSATLYPEFDFGLKFRLR
ncbi:MAG: caspase family protein [Treponema sp.]|nr:caspase family protein [Treponema sp.]MEE3434412.1 caspase family protein [Treponema sp.]